MFDFCSWFEKVLEELNKVIFWEFVIIRFNKFYSIGFGSWLIIVGLIFGIKGWINLNMSVKVSWEN